MVGRLAVRAPWIFAQARALEAALPGASEAPAASQPAVASQPAAIVLAEVDLEETALRFLELLVRYQPPEFHLSRARRFFSYFCDNLVWANYLKNLLGREKDLAGIEAVLSAYFQDHPEERRRKI
jgi:tRNA-dihydrouridine synthase